MYIKTVYTTQLHIFTHTYIFYFCSALDIYIYAYMYMYDMYMCVYICICQNFSPDNYTSDLSTLELDFLYFLYCCSSTMFYYRYRAWLISSLLMALRCFCVFAIINNSVVNNLVHVSFQTHLSISTVCMLRHGISGWQGKYICKFDIYFPISALICIPTSHECLFPPRPHHYLVLSNF